MLGLIYRFSSWPCFCFWETFVSVAGTHRPKPSQGGAADSTESQKSAGFMLRLKLLTNKSNLKVNLGRSCYQTLRPLPCSLGTLLPCLSCHFSLLPLIPTFLLTSSTAACRSPSWYLVFCWPIFFAPSILLRDSLLRTPACLAKRTC